LRLNEEESEMYRGGRTDDAMRPGSEGRLTDCVGPRVGARVASYLSAALSRALPMGFARRRSDDDDDDGDRTQDILPPSGHLPPPVITITDIRP